MVDSTRDQMPPDQHEASALLQISNPPEDPIVYPICQYHKSEDGASCVTIHEPCNSASIEKPIGNKCPEREPTSDRAANPPASKEEKAPEVEGPPKDKKPEPVKKTTEALAQRNRNEHPAVDAVLKEGEDKPKDPIPATPNQKTNPNYCVYKARASGEPHPDACKCKYVKNDKGKCVPLTNDCLPSAEAPSDC